ncbi:methyltransferase-like protein 6 [Canna indica]|uniref:tRNA N(3)-methylcytidine methyltransferase n=1 Tax=Canna indica TaxID=4628 RepID=A0AAQ3KIM2_9LILI|nr:methyltransferase-like protein 6 [Canna indica]
MAEETAAEYHSKDFEWEELRLEVENDPSLRYHLTPFISSACSSDATTDEADAWRSFHRRHSAGKFFKERRYLLKEFPELIHSGDSIQVLEVGCGNGSTVLPILRAKQSTIVYACDCSEEVLKTTREIVATASGASLDNRLHTFVLDLSVYNFPDWLFCASCQRNSGSKHVSSSDSRDEKAGKLNAPYFLTEDQCCIGGVDFVTLIFTLSAIPFHRMSSVIEKCLCVLKPGQFLLFRDYGLYDMTMLRFLPEQRVGFCEYMRSDGTFSYFFSLDTARDLFTGAGFIELELEYCCITSVNRRSGKKMQRVWVHGKFQKPV